MANQRCLLGQWIMENNQVVDRWKRQGAHMFSRDQDQSRLRSPSSDFHKLLMKIKGVPATVDLAQLELTVVYNACVFSIAQSQVSQAEALLTEALERALRVTGKRAERSSERRAFWRAVLTHLADSPLSACVRRLLCLQWAVWLANHRLTHIQELKEELSSLSDRLSAPEEEEERPAGSDPTRTLRLVADPRQVQELLDICTVVAQGADWLSDGRHSEALSELQRAFSLPAPRNLLADAQILSGQCLANMGRPHMAMQCYMKAVEMDPRCAGALHHCVLLYGRLGNAQAELEGLRLLNAALRLPPASDVYVEVCPLHASALLSGPTLKSLLAVPQASSILHSLALKCVLQGRVAEGVEHYLDLLADLHSDHPQTVHTGVVPVVPVVPPRVAELYLEAAAALLQAGRSADCMALCEEVLSSTLELLPERLTLEDPPPQGDHGGSPPGPGSDQDALDAVLWAGGAHLLQAHCQAHLKDWKQAVTLYTRCVNLTGKVCLRSRGFQTQVSTVDPASPHWSQIRALQRLKGLSLAGRGISFAQRDQLREALRDLQLSTQVSPEGVSSGLWLGEVLWRLDRGPEAAPCWRKSLAAEPTAEALPLYLQEPKSSPYLDPNVLRTRLEDLTQT